jgi:hypothetical protein
MWTLIKRECTEVFIYAIVIALIAAGSILAAAYLQKDRDLGVCIFGFFIMALILAAASVSRMVLDRTHGFSTFYTSHLTTRKHIFAARLAAGLCLIAIYCIPGAIWLIYQVKLVHVDSGFTLNLQSPFMIRLTILAVLMLTACFTLGLMMGLSSKRIMYSLGTLGLVVLLFTVVVIGGFQYSTIAILLLLNASLLYACRKHYLAMPL